MKKKIALITGGFSEEAVVSYKSAATVTSYIDKEKFDVYLVDVHRNGWEYVDNKNARRVQVDKNDFSIPLDTGKIRFDAALIYMHGTPGEDGKLQGYLDMLNIPYTGCGAAVSALTFNKKQTTIAVSDAGIHVARSVRIVKNTTSSIAALTRHLQFPLFVKPNNGGSSIGMSKVSDPASLQGAIEKAFETDTEIIVEEYIAGREYTIGVYKEKNKIICLPLTEVISNNDFFDYEAKYNGKSTHVTPAVTPPGIAHKITNAAQRIYEVLDCRSLVRIDFIVNELNQEPYMLEVNTIPGQSEASIIPEQLQVAGISPIELYSKQLEEILAYA